MKKKNLILIIAFMVIAWFPTNVFASKATCTYNYNNTDIIYTYEYGVLLKYTTSDKNKVISNNLLSNNDFVNQETGEIFCPKLRISYTPTDKNRGKFVVKKDDDGKDGILKILVQDNKEKNSPNSNNYQCNYTVNDDKNKKYSLVWDGNRVRITFLDNLEGYTATIRNCDASVFANGCPKEVYDQLVSKDQKIIIDCKNKIMTDNDQSNKLDSSTNVDTGVTTPNQNNNNNNNNSSETKDQYIGNITCGGLTNFTFHKRVPKLTSTLYNLLKVAIPVILVIKGMMDMFKAMSAGKEDEMKKAQKKFINRLIAALCAFIVFILVETVIGWISDRTGNENAMKCVDCFINNKCDNN